MKDRNGERKEEPTKKPSDKAANRVCMSARLNISPSNCVNEEVVRVERANEEVAGNRTIRHLQPLPKPL